MKLTDLAFTAIGTVALVAALHPSPAGATTDDDIYLHIVRNSGVSYTQGSDTQLISLAHTVCDSFDRGLSINQVNNTLNQYFPMDQTSAIVGAGTQSYCPRWTFLFNT